jgi:hypothetical protein
MINSRSVVISVFAVALFSAPLARAQGVQPPGSTTIQEIALQPQPLLAGLSFQAESISSSAQLPDLSRYREFQLGMTLPEVAKRTDTDLSEVTVVHQRPVLIQEVDWRPSSALESSSTADPLESVNFSFYSGELFRMVVNYAEDRTEGLTEADLIKAISSSYGVAARPAGKTALVSLSLTDSSTEKVLARWETAQYSVSLFRSPGESSFGILLLSKRLDTLARTAATEGARIDEREAPEREMARQKQQDDDDRAAQAKAKEANQAAFRP